MVTKNRKVTEPAAASAAPAVPPAGNDLPEDTFEFEKKDPEVVEPVAPKPSTEDEKKQPHKSQCRTTLFLYRQLYLLQKQLRYVGPRIDRSSDKVLASIAYPAQFIAYFTKSARLLKLSSTIGDYRTLSRLVATPSTIELALSMFLQNKNPDTLDRFGDYIQALSYVFYQVFEDIAYLSDKGLIKLSPQRTADFWVWSSIAWGFDILVVLLRAPYYHYVLKKEVNLRSVLVNAAWLPLCYHWSTYKGVFDTNVVGLLGTYAQWSGLVHQWTRPL